MNRLHLDYLEYNFYLSTSLKWFKSCINLIKEGNESFMDLLIRGISMLARIGRLEFANEFLSEPLIDKFDTKISTTIKNTKSLIQGIEQYQCGLWKDAADSFNTYCNNDTNFIDFQRLIRTFERGWYILITSVWGEKEGVYLPVNALNYVFEEANHLYDPDVDYFVTTPYLQRRVDIQNVSQKEWDIIFLSMFKTMFKLYEIIKENYTYNIKQMIHWMFSKLN